MLLFRRTQISFQHQHQLEGSNNWILQGPLLMCTYKHSNTHAYINLKILKYSDESSVSPIQPEATHITITSKVDLLAQKYTMNSTFSPCILFSYTEILLNFKILFNFMCMNISPECMKVNTCINQIP